MQRWLRLAAAIDAFHERVGRVAAWLSMAMVAIGAFNAIARYLGRYLGHNLSSNAYIEAQWYMFSLLFLLGAAFTLRHDGHVRVDVLYGRLPPRTRAWINLVGTALFLIPFCILTMILSWPSVRSSWSVFETSPDPGGLPRYPIKTVILVAFALLTLQGVAWIIQNLARVRGVDVPATDDHGSIEGI